MNLSPLGRRLAAALVTVMLVLTLGACGKKGPLYLPDNGNSSNTQQGG